MMEVKETRTDVFVVSLDRDGKGLQYEFVRTPPEGPDDWATLDYGDQIFVDLMDYELKPIPGQPHGALTIPAINDICQIVYRFARGTKIDFPVLLDER